MCLCLHIAFSFSLRSPGAGFKPTLRTISYFDCIWNDLLPIWSYSEVGGSVIQHNFSGKHNSTHNEFLRIVLEMPRSARRWTWTSTLLFPHTFLLSCFSLVTVVLLMLHQGQHTAANASKPSKKHRRDNGHWRCQCPCDAAAAWCSRLCLLRVRQVLTCPTCDLTPWVYAATRVVCTPPHLMLCFCPSSVGPAP